MRSSHPEWILMIAPFAVSGGISLAIALKSGGTIAWTILGLSTFICVLILTLTILWARQNR